MHLHLPSWGGSRPSRLARRLPVALLLSAVLLGCGCSGSQPADRPFPELGGVGPEVYSLAQQSVVRVEAGMRTGTGFVISEEGEVLTAAHVLRDALIVRVELADGSDPVAAEVVGYDEVADLALLRVPQDVAAHLTPMVVASPEGEALSPGQEVWTVGHPGGRRWSVARGVVAQLPESGEHMVTSLRAEAGSSGAPVLVYRKPGHVEVVGVISRVLGDGSDGPSVAIRATQLPSHIAALRGGLEKGSTDPQAFVASVRGRSPLVHQTVLARHIDIEDVDLIDMPFDTLQVAGFPALETLEVRTTWRYFFAGTHTFRFRVSRLPAEGPPLVIHEGPLRTFELADERGSYVYKVEIDVRLPERGDYIVEVTTDGGLSSVVPFTVVESGQPVPTTPLAWPFQRRPGHHAMLLASHVDPLTDADDDESGDAPIPASEEDEADAPGEDAAAGVAQGASAGGAGSPDSHPASGLRIRGTFNMIRLDHFPTVVQFDTWTRWGYAFAGEHTFRHVLVDATGAVIAETEPQPFTLADDRASYQHVGQWEVELTAAGMHFLVCTTDGLITRALPIWVQGPEAP